MQSSLDNSGQNYTPRSQTMGDYSEHMRNFSAQGGVLLGERRAGNATHSLLSRMSGMPAMAHGPMPKPAMVANVQTPPRLY